MAKPKPKGTPKRGKHNHASPRPTKPPSSSPAKQKVKAVDLVRIASSVHDELSAQHAYPGIASLIASDSNNRVLFLGDRKDHG